LAADYPEPLLQQVLPALTRPRPELLGLASYLVAVQGGRIVAVGGWSRSPPGGGVGTGDVGHIRHVACDPPFLRRGITTVLMRNSIAGAARAGVRLLSCLSTRTAAPFYRAIGFEGEAEIKLRISPGVLFPAVEMRRRLGG
jgi:N-acetylglutamate synthase-like GNAT family acetyltransferase